MNEHTVSTQKTISLTQGKYLKHKEPSLQVVKEPYVDVAAKDNYVDKGDVQVRTHE